MLNAVMIAMNVGVNALDPIIIFYSFLILFAGASTQGTKELKNQN